MPFKESRLVFADLDKKRDMPTSESQSFFIERQLFQERLPIFCNGELNDYLEKCGDEKMRNVIAVETDEGEMPLITEVITRLKRGVDEYLQRNISLLSRMWEVGKEVDITSNVFEEMLLSVIKDMLPKICREVYLELDNERLKLDSMRDELTGLPNRRAYNDHKTIEIAYSHRNGPLAILIFDIDHFKKVNDEQGHLAGDQVLRELGGRIKEVTRDSDFVCRWGGEEFVVLMRNTPLQDAKLGAARIQETISVEPFKVEDESGNTVMLQKTVSIGGAIFGGIKEDGDGDKMEKIADNCLYVLKGERPDAEGVTRDRRGHIAFNGEVVPEEEIDDLRNMFRNRDRRGKMVTVR